MFETIVIVAILGFVVWAYFTPQGKAKMAEAQAEQKQRKLNKQQDKAWKERLKNQPIYDEPVDYSINRYSPEGFDDTATQPISQPHNNEPRQRVPKEEASHTMVYVDSKGSLSEREINLRGVEAKNGKLYVNAYCFKRKRLRTFVAKNIISLRDYATDKTFTDEDEIYNELLAWITTTQPHT